MTVTTGDQQQDCPCLDLRLVQCSIEHEDSSRTLQSSAGGKLHWTLAQWLDSCNYFTIQHSLPLYYHKYYYLHNILLPHERP